MAGKLWQATKLIVNAELCHAGTKPDVSATKNSVDNTDGSDETNLVATPTYGPAGQKSALIACLFNPDYGI